MAVDPKTIANCRVAIEPHAAGCVEGSPAVTALRNQVAVANQDYVEPLNGSIFTGQDTLGGLNVLTCNDAGSIKQAAEASTPAYVGPQTVFLVVQPRNPTGATSYVIGSHNTSTATNMDLLSSNLRVRIKIGSVTRDANLYMEYGVPTLVTIYGEDTGFGLVGLQKVRGVDNIDAEQDSNLVFGTCSAGRNQLGANSGGTLSFDGFLGVYYVFDRLLTAQEMTDIQDWILILYKWKTGGEKPPGPAPVVDDVGMSLKLNLKL